MKALDGYYQILGVASDSKIGEVMMGFKRKALNLHPDREQGYSGFFF